MQHSVTINLVIYVMHVTAAGKLSARDMAAAVTDLLDETHITKLNNTEEHDKLLQQQPKLAKVCGTYAGVCHLPLFVIV